MYPSLLMTFDAAGERRIAQDDLARVIEQVVRVPGLTQGLIFTPPTDMVDHPFMDDGMPPVLALQLRFASLPAVEAAAVAGSVLAKIAAAESMASLGGLRVTHQAMITRPFPVDEPHHPPETRYPCSYLVHYPGMAENLNAWLRHYLDHHPQIMRTFPSVREIEIFTRVDLVDGLPSRRVDYMQRNKLVFDGPAALSAALLSPVIKTMRADYGRFPPFSGANIHYPMETRFALPTQRDVP